MLLTRLPLDVLPLVPLGLTVWDKAGTHAEMVDKLPFFPRSHVAPLLQTASHFLEVLLVYEIIGDQFLVRVISRSLHGSPPIVWSAAGINYYLYAIWSTVDAINRVSTEIIIYCRIYTWLTLRISS